MKHANDRDPLVTDSIDKSERRASDKEFARTGHAAGSAKSGILQESFGGVDDSLLNGVGGSG